MSADTQQALLLAVGNLNRLLFRYFEERYPDMKLLKEHDTVKYLEKLDAFAIHDQAAIKIEVARNALKEALSAMNANGHVHG